MDTNERVAWAKERALAELERGSIVNAIASLASDLPDNFAVLQMSMQLVMGGHLSTVQEVRTFIEGVN